MWEGTAEKVTYHVRARDCKMQKMRASPLLCHWNKNDMVTGMYMTRGTHQKGEGKLKKTLTQKAEHRVSAKHS